MKSTILRIAVNCPGNGLVLETVPASLQLRFCTTIGIFSILHLTMKYSYFSFTNDKEQRSFFCLVGKGNC